MDLKDWKKVGEHKLGVEMQHPKGHKMTILYKGVPVIQREALKRLPLYDGGKVKGVHKSEYDRPAKEIKNEYSKHNAGESKAGEHLRNEDIRPGGKLKAMDEHNRVLGEMKSMPQPKLKGLAKGGKPSDGDDLDKSLESGLSDSEEAAEPQPPAPQVAAPAPTSAAPAAQGLQTSPPAGGPDAALAGAYGQASNLLNKVQAQNLANRATIEKAHQNFSAYNASPESQIDARQYVKNMSLPSKVSTAIGMFLGGFSVPFGGQNYTQTLLNDQINRNIEAQKENYQHQKNVWGAAHDLFGDEQVANNFAKTVALEQVNNLVRQSALNVGTPKAQERAQVLINGNQIQQNQLKDQSAKHLTAKQMSQRTPGLLDRLGSYLPGGNGFYNSDPASSQANTPESGTMPPEDQEHMSTEVPDAPLPQFNVDEQGVKRSQFLGAEGNIPNQITPGEVGSANDEMGRVGQFNDKIKLIHQNFADLWKNRSDGNQTLKYLSSLGVNLEGIHIQPPDLSTWASGPKAYWRAANRIRQELATLVGNGALTHEQAESVLTNLIKQDDSPDDYKNILKQVDGNIMSTIKTPVLEKYGKITRPKIED